MKAVHSAAAVLALLCLICVVFFPRAFSGGAPIKSRFRRITNPACSTTLRTGAI